MTDITGRKKRRGRNLTHSSLSFSVLSPSLIILFSGFTFTVEVFIWRMYLWESENVLFVKDRLNAFLLRCLSAKWYLECWVFGAGWSWNISDYSCFFSVLPRHTRSLRVSDWRRCVCSVAAPTVQITSFWQIEESLGAAVDVSQVVGNQGQRFPLGDDRGELMCVDTVEIPRSLLSSWSHLAK